MKKLTLSLALLFTVFCSICAVAATTTPTVNSVTKAVNGGTGVASPTAHAVMIGEGASAMNAVACTATGNVLTSNGPNADPSCQAFSGAGYNIGLGNGLTNTAGSNNSSPLSTTNTSLFSQTFPTIYTSSQAISSANAAGLAIYNSASPGTFTLAQAGVAGIVTGSAFNFSNRGAGALTITATGGSSFFGVPLTSGSIVLTQNGSASCVADASNNYDCISSVVSSSGVSQTPIALVTTGATMTPNFGTNTNFFTTLVHANCPCTLANPSGGVTPGQTGNFVVTQSSTGGDTIGTLGSFYKTTSGAAITLSNLANAEDNFGYYAESASSIILKPVTLNVKNNNTTPITIEGALTATTTMSTTIALSMTTTMSNDVIDCIVRVQATGIAYTPVSMAGGGLTWTQRTPSGGIPWTFSATLANISEWTAVAASPLTSQTLTATLSGSDITQATRLVCFGANGLNTASPFDPNVSLPANTSSTTGSTPSLTISTTNTNTLLIGVLSDGSGSVSLGTVTRPSGFTQLLATGSFADYSKNIVSSPQSSVAENWSFTGGSNGYGVLIDALTQ